MLRRWSRSGDTAVDLLAAHNAGVMGVGVLSGGLTRVQLSVHPHAHILDSAADLLSLPELVGGVLA